MGKTKEEGKTLYIKRFLAGKCCLVEKKSLEKVYGAVREGRK